MGFGLANLNWLWDKWALPASQKYTPHCPWYSAFSHTKYLRWKNIDGAVLLLVKLKNVIFSKVAGFSRQLKLKLTLLHGCFSRCLNCTNSTKLRKASHFGPFFRFRGVLLIFTRKKVEIVFYFFFLHAVTYINVPFLFD